MNKLNIGDISRIIYIVVPFIYISLKRLIEFQKEEFNPIFVYILSLRSHVRQLVSTSSCQIYLVVPYVEFCLFFLQSVFAMTELRT